VYLQKKRRRFEKSTEKIHFFEDGKGKEGKNGSAVS